MLNFFTVAADFTTGHVGKKGQNRFGGHAACYIAGIMAAHAVRHNEQVARRSNVKKIFILGPHFPWVALSRRWKCVPRVMEQLGYEFVKE